MFNLNNLRRLAPDGSRLDERTDGAYNSSICYYHNALPTYPCIYIHFITHTYSSIYLCYSICVSTTADETLALAYFHPLIQTQKDNVWSCEQNSSTKFSKYCSRLHPYRIYKPRSLGKENYITSIIWIEGITTPWARPWSPTPPHPVDETRERCQIKIWYHNVTT
jgi:hypothetical protein